MTDRRKDLQPKLAQLPTIPLATLPTPLEESPRLAARIGVDRLLVKRDDMTGLAFGGNKVRELEYFLGAAVHEGADTFVAGGGSAQSNHARQCAAAARRAGLDVHLVLRGDGQADAAVGNLLITRLLAPTIHWVDRDPGLDDRDGLADVMRDVATMIEAHGGQAWILPSSFHPLGAAAYVAAALELDTQLRDRGVTKATIACTSMGATRVGIDLAVDALELDWTVVAAGWRPVDDGLATRLAGLAAATARLLGLDWGPPASRFSTIDSGGPAYGVPSPEGTRALRLAAETEGLLLDPVYTAKGFAGIVDAIDSGSIDREAPLVFVHTGGTPALFSHYDPSEHGTAIDEGTAS